MGCGRSCMARETSGSHRKSGQKAPSRKGLFRAAMFPVLELASAAPLPLEAWPPAGFATVAAAGLCRVLMAEAVPGRRVTVPGRMAWTSGSLRRVVPLRACSAFVSSS